MRLLILLLALLALPTAAVHAQPPAPTAIPLGDILVGTLDAATPRVLYRYRASPGQSVIVEVSAVSPGLAPQLVVRADDGALLAAVTNPELADAAVRTLTFQRDADYTLAVFSALAAEGQFTLRLSETARPSAPTRLAVGDAASGTLPPQGGVAFALSASPFELLALAVFTGDAPGVRATLSNAGGVALGTLGEQLSGGALQLPAGATGYVLTLTNTTDAALPYEVRLAPASAAPTGAFRPVPSATPTPRPVPTLAQAGPCVVATAGAAPVNVRRGPGASFPVVASLSPADALPANARDALGQWYRITVGRVTGWVAASVTRTGGDCARLPVVDLGTPAPDGLPPLLSTATATPR